MTPNLAAMRFAVANRASVISRFAARAASKISGGAVAGVPLHDRQVQAEGQAAVTRRKFSVGLKSILGYPSQGSSPSKEYGK